MTKYEIPTEMRDFAEKSVDQARKAFESFIGAAQKASTDAEGAAASVSTNAKEVATKAVSFAEANVKAAFDLAQKLVQAKDVQEILNHQSEFAKAQLASIQEQAKEIGEAVKKAVAPKA